MMATSSTSLEMGKPHHWPVDEGFKTVNLDKPYLSKSSSIVNEILMVLNKVSKTSTGWKACCPAHPDKNPSLSISVKDGKILFYCHAGCSIDSILDSLGLVKSDLFIDEKESKPDKQDRRIVATYDYNDETGKLLFQVIRYEPKGFAHRHPDNNGGWIWKGIPEEQRVLYNLPDVKSAIVKGETIYIGEGEKDCLSLKAIGLTATCNSGGAGKWLSQYTESLRGASVVILPDGDVPGQSHGQNIAHALHGIASSIKLINLDQHDVTDWINAGHTKDELIELVNAAGQWEPENNKPNSCLYKACTITEILELELPELGYVIDPVFPEQGLVMTYGHRGNGKTWFGLTLAYAAATGSPVFNTWKANAARKVVYIDGEMPARTMQERFASIVKGFDKEPPEPDYLKIITPDIQDRSMPNLATLDGQDAIWPIIQDADLIWIDNLACLCRHGRENDSESWLPIQQWLLSLRRLRKAVGVVHHSNKSGGQRGTISKEDVLDTVIQLKRPMDYDPMQGARFEVHLDKARGIYGQQAQPFELTLNVTDGAAIWLTRTIEDVDRKRVMELKGEGLSIRDIAQETGLSKSKVSRLIKPTKED